MTDASRQEEAARPRVGADAPAATRDAARGVFDSAMGAAVGARRPDAAEDAVELWGRRIGRGLSLAGCVVLGLYLFFKYVR